MASSAEWNDEHLKVVCELFAEQVRIGNRPNTHLNTVGYAEVAKGFKDIIGLEYTKTQFKNKWDKLKSEYTIWKKLTTRETGTGWDSEKGTISQPLPWWKKVNIVSVVSFFSLWAAHIFYLS